MVLSETGIFCRSVEYRLWRRSGWATISDMNVVVWRRISDTVVVVVMAVELSGANVQVLSVWLGLFCF